MLSFRRSLALFLDEEGLSVRQIIQPCIPNAVVSCLGVLATWTVGRLQALWVL